MRRYCTTIKNKAYIFLEVIIISFLFISLTLFVQILLNNSFKLYKVDYETQENFQNLDFLNEIMKVEIRYIENTFNFVNIHFKKKIIIKDKNYLILATVKYEVGSSRDLGSLYNGVLTRMWIKEDV